MSENNHASKSSSKYDSPSSFLIEEEQEQVFSSEMAVMDFITLRGIQTRTGVDEKHLPLFVLKEMMDNALDHVEKSGGGNTTTTQQQPKVTVAITLEENSLLHIRVSNSNHSNKGIFTEGNVRKIFSYTSSMSSKRNQFKITRGALGDAFKELLSIPYALAIEGLGFDKWEKPLIIRDSASRKEFTVKLKVDKAKQGIEPIFAVEDLSSDSKWYYLSSLYKTDKIHEIQVDLFLPFDSRSAAESMIRKFKDLLNQYLYNTHVVFNFRIDDLANRNIWMNLETQQAKEIVTNTKKNNNKLQQQELQQQQLTSIHY